MNCPLCNEPNHCAMEADHDAKDCWCVNQFFPKALLDAVPEKLKNKACICRNCLTDSMVDHQ